MTRAHTIPVLALAVVACALLTASASVGAQEPAPLLSIVSAGARMDDISVPDLRRVFMGEVVKDADGNRLVPFNFHARNPVRARFDRLVLRMTPDQAGRYWIGQKIRGARTAPRSVGSPAILVKVVQRIPGAIGYLPSDQPKPGVKALRVGGKRPGDRGYPLAGR